MAQHRIMVVDDEEDIRAVIVQTLNSKYEVLEANDGLDALEKLQRVEPDFVVMDVMMPLMDGFKACQAIRKHPVYAQMPVLFLSALNTRDDMKKGYASGANLYLTKPFDPQRLLRNIDVFFETQDIPIREKTHSLQELAAALAEAPPEPAAPPKPKPSPPPIKKIPVSPAVGQRPRNLAETPPDRGGSSERPRLMIVDDDADLVAMLDTALGKSYEITRAYDGIEAIEKIVSYEPDLVLIDGMMPRMTGYQLCTSLRRNVRYRDTPILFMSAKSTPKDIAYAERIGGTDFIAKPFDLSDLRQKLSALCLAPGFCVAPKRLNIVEINKREKQHDSERTDREKQRQLKLAGQESSGKEEGDLEKFLREMGSS
jgi:CheY-like chemotaxis protein